MSQDVIRKVRFVSDVTPQMALRIERNTTVHRSWSIYYLRQFSRPSEPVPDLDALRIRHNSAGAWAYHRYPPASHAHAHTRIQRAQAAHVVRSLRTILFFVFVPRLLFLTPAPCLRCLRPLHYRSSSTSTVPVHHPRSASRRDVRDGLEFAGGSAEVGDPLHPIPHLAPMLLVLLLRSLSGRLFDSASSVARTPTALVSTYPAAAVCQCT
jgi:hypothetical protein